MKVLTVYYRPSCAFSLGAINFLLLRGADFRVVNLNLHHGEEMRVARQLGDRKLETPVLEADGQLWVAPANSDIKDHLEHLGLERAAAPYDKLKELGER
jgi:glutaredoxin